MLIRSPSTFLSSHSLTRIFLRNLSSNVTKKSKHGKKKKENSAKVEKVKKEYKAPTKKYQHTLFLPQSTFPLSPARKVEEELETQSSQCWQDVYSWQRSQADRTLEFVLHDGPPYANGALHMGHALNKILKDITVRHKLLQGYKVHYVPGWDCHGLPIELKALQHDGGHSTTDAVTTRERARNFANSCMEDQKAGFLRWGIMADWDNAYVTHSPKFVCRQLRLFTQLYEEGLIFQDHLPVHYSPSSLTTLAESELEYNKHHTSLTVLVAFKVLPGEAVASLLEGTGASCLHLPIFTTTPWTLPFNKAVCFGETLSYSVITTHTHGADTALLWASELLSEAEKTCGPFTVKKTVLGKDLPSPLHYSPPFQSPSTPHPLLPGSHVTDDVGTGLVHTAPAHGKDDHLIGLQYNLDRQSSVSDDGCYTSGVHESLTGLKVLTEGNEKVLELMKAHKEGDLLVLKSSKVEHSYPYDWRTNEPVIVRASRQWFLKLSLLQEKAKALLSDVQTYPHLGGMKLLTQQMNRVHWCISRQRVWGTPLPVFYEGDKPFFSREISDHVIRLMERDGCDVWWTLPETELLPPQIVEDYVRRGKDLPVKGTDILDVWFDSGCTFTALEGRKADLVIEGSDQFRGWFQSSLLLSVAATGSPSYKSILSHGFTVDENGHKMSKSVGNVVSPDVVFEKRPDGGAALGADAMRWWAAKQGTDGSHPQCSLPLLTAEANEMHSLRRTLKFLSGCLKGYNGDSVHYEQLPLLEKFALHRLTKFNTSVWTAYNEYRYHSVIRCLVDYLSTELSQVYFTCIKHRLYCSGKDRQSIQWVLSNVLNTVLMCSTPVVPHLTQLLANHQYPGRVVQMETVSALPAEWWNPEVEKRVMTAIRLREHFNKHHIEEHKKNYRRLRVIVRTSGEAYDNLVLLQGGCEKSVDSPVCEMLGVAEVIIRDGGEEEFSLLLEDTNYSACERCRKHRIVETNSLCTECDDIVNT